jgi:uncharacterized Rossmann fold enzyme
MHRADDRQIKRRIEHCQEPGFSVDLDRAAFVAARLEARRIMKRVSV